ncbi:MAG: hypothetical protein WAM60_01185 [Candidatus Promineifilaceae bacterium]
MEENVPAEFEGESFPAFPSSTDLMPEVVDEADPLLERMNDFWEQFMDAPYEKEWALVENTLAEEPELFDDEMVFEVTNDLFPKAVEAGEIERYKQLLNQLEETVPDAYNEELGYILEWRIQIALMEEDEAALERYFNQFSPLAGDKWDTYYRVIRALAYHGKLEILYQGMRQARPYVAEGGDLLTWANKEFTAKVADLEILYQTDRNPDLRSDNPLLQQHFAEYELTISPEKMSHLLGYCTGHEKLSWSVADFILSNNKKRRDGVNENYLYLFSAFTHYAHEEEGIALTKAKMVVDELKNYFELRHKGELDKTVNDDGRRRKRKRKQRNKQIVSDHPLCPDAATLDTFMARLMGFMSFRYYEAAALFELMPVWLRFLTKYDLLDEETRQWVVQSLSYLKGHLVQIADSQLSDPAVKENLLDWPI